MAFVRAFEFDVGVSPPEFGFVYPVSNPDGSGHEFLYLYGPFRFSSEVELPSATPSSGSAPAVNSTQVGVMK